VAALSEDNSIEWEAAQWVAVQMGGESFDREGFDAWLAGDPRRKPLFDTMWQRIMSPGMDGALGAFVQQRRLGWSLLAGGAAVLVALSSGYMAWPSLELFLAQSQEYVAANGTIRKVSLEDGTQLTLAGGANVRVWYTSHNREVELTRGTIFADVVHDEDRPFRIDSGDARITDIGTRFEVSKKPASLRVTVASGAVRFGNGGWFGKQLDLTTDQAAILSEAGLNRSESVGRGAIARWRMEWVEYNDTPMRQVVADLESVSPLPIKIADKGLAELKVSGRIRLIDPEKQIENLSVIHDFAVDRRDGAIVLSRGRTGP
jgi:transmembrane sensor